jgi:hypothetical protein
MNQLFLSKLIPLHVMRMGSDMEVGGTKAILAMSYHQIPFHLRIVDFYICCILSDIAFQSMNQLFSSEVIPLHVMRMGSDMEVGGTTAILAMSYHLIPSHQIWPSWYV